MVRASPLIQFPPRLVLVLTVPRPCANTSLRIEGSRQTEAAAAERRRAIARRRSAALGVAALAFIVGIAIGGGGDGDRADGAGRAPPRPRRSRRRSRRPCRCPAGRDAWSCCASPARACPATCAAVLSEGRAAGAILFRDNLTAPTRRSGSPAAEAGPDGRRYLIDQEGGDIRIFPWAPPATSQPQQAATGTVGRGRRGRGAALRRAASTSRSRRSATSPACRTPRSAGARSRPTSRPPPRRWRSVRGWRKGGVAPTAKHFPGSAAP